MSKIAYIEDFLVRSPIVGLSLYGALICLFGFVIWNSVADMVERQQAVAMEARVLGQFEQRRARTGDGVDLSNSGGSPFVEGATVTVAGATLLQRVASAIAKYDGNTLSSQVELNGNRSKAGFVSVVATCDIDQSGVQKLLYDLEAGMPFLFVDQLVVQAPAVSTTAPGGKLRLLVGVSGQWQGAK
jgi:general secretion pathway protein M